ncbi:Fpg/Nei family DNA glycosylase [Georgenia sp. AZ-5]|uniref:Fpg/Nei family DNA glycosylase n=1 Tax=Georgenia sp. AZ-5 TaxID=3367526 RepID=UPI003754F8CA
MPEGHTVHRLAYAFAELFGGQRLEVSSPQGRFADGAALLDGHTLVTTEAHGKQLFLGFAPDGAAPNGAQAPRDAAPGEATPGEITPWETPPDGLRWLRVHLGLYGSWTFAGDSSFRAPHAIGAPRRRVSEEETALPPLSAESAASPGGSAPSPDDAPDDVPAPVGAPAGEGPSGDPGGRRAPEAVPAGAAAEPSPPGAGTGPLALPAWHPPAPRGAVRVRLLGEHGVADLTGPTACEVVTWEEKAAVHARLGPDPLRRDGDRDAFVEAVRARRRAVGELLMDQSVVSGVGNIYRAEALYRARLHPLRLGRDVPAARLRAMWDDLAALMADGVATGRIVTTRPEHRRDDDDRWYVYRRSGEGCLVCGTRVAETPMAGRRVFWCPRCQRAPRSS